MTVITHYLSLVLVWTSISRRRRKNPGDIWIKNTSRQTLTYLDLRRHRFEKQPILIVGKLLGNIRRIVTRTCSSNEMTMIERN